MADDPLYARFGREFPRGHVLFREGDTGREMFVIQAGKVRIAKGAGEVETTLGVFGAGEFFGEMSILNNKPRSATAIVEEDAKLLVIDPKIFEAMVRGNAEIAVRMIKKLAARLQQTDEQIEYLMMRDPNRRIVHYLNNLAKRGKPPTEGGELALDIQANDLADALGLELESVMGFVIRLERRNMLRVGNKALVLTDLPQLREYLLFLEMQDKYRGV